MESVPRKKTTLSLELPDTGSRCPPRALMAPGPEPVSSAVDAQTLSDVFGDPTQPLPAGILEMFSHDLMQLENADGFLDD